MAEAEKKAQSLYEMLVASAPTRPTSFHIVEQMRAATTAWKQNNPAFRELAQAADARINRANI
jgi:hypothetical protein